MDNHFKGINEQERFNNELLNEIRKTNQLLEQLISDKSNKGSGKNGTTNRQQRTKSSRRNPE